MRKIIKRDYMITLRKFKLCRVVKAEGLGGKRRLEKIQKSANPSEIIAHRTTLSQPLHNRGRRFQKILILKIHTVKTRHKTRIGAWRERTVALKQFRNNK